MRRGQRFQINIPLAISLFQFFAESVVVAFPVSVIADEQQQQPVTFIVGICKFVSINPSSCC
jgi:hypothetical protein